GIGALSNGFGLAGASVAAVATSLFGNIAIKWSSKRSSKQERSLDYTFIVDRSVQTLDRDLPLVVDRIRQAGLAPVFVIDELDKVSTPETEIGDLIRRLKHLVADYGFFCFLTDRDYYEYFRNKLQTEAYPREYTYFTNWLFIQYQPDDLRQYL